MTHLRKQRRGFTLIELAAVLTVSTVLFSLASPAIQSARETARRSACKKKLKQIGLAIHNYSDVYRRFPPGWTGHHAVAGAEGRYGWSIMLTPLLGNAEIYEQINFEDQKQRRSKVTQTGLPAFRCPSDTTEVLNPLRGNFGTSNYSANFGSTAPPRWLDAGMSANWPGQAATLRKTDGICWWNSGCRFRDIMDGTSNTLMVGERSVASAAGIWMGVRGNNFESDQVTDCSPGNEINSGEGSFSSTHKGGAQFALCDGSVRFISEKIESGIGADGHPKTFQRLGSRQDKLVPGEF
jgi:prepilin-type N-terminal cleavage/methylation domain-containing protein/prepilin-type processing-associated H-X9-DG protein